MKSNISKQSQRITVVTAITVASISFAMVLGNVSNAMAQASLFSQPVRVNINKTNQIIGNYGLVIRDMDSGNHVENTYSDSPNSPRIGFIDGAINVHDGDRLLACVMQMNTQDMACDMQTAYYSQSVAEFFVNMNNASPAPQQNNDDGGGGGNQQGEFDQFNPNSPSNAFNADGGNTSSSSSGSTFLPPTININTVH